MRCAAARRGLPPTRADRRTRALAVAAILAALLSRPAQAQVGASVTLSSEQRARGEATSGGRPVATFDLSYDHPGGFYLGGSITGVATARSGVRVLDTAIYVGVAHRLESGPTIDVGVIDTRYSEYGGLGRAAGYAEVYAGVLGERVSTHLHFSPGYYRRDVSSFYAELDGVLDPAATWRVSGHVGVLVPVSGPARGATPRASYDWRVGVQRPIGRFDLRLALTGGAPAHERYGWPLSRDPALVISLGCTF